MYEVLVTCFVLARTVLSAVWTAHTCLLLSNIRQIVAVPTQDSIRPCRAHAVLSGYCNIYIHVHVRMMYVHMYM